MCLLVCVYMQQWSGAEQQHQTQSATGHLNGANSETNRSDRNKQAKQNKLPSKQASKLTTKQASKLPNTQANKQTSDEVYPLGYTFTYTTLRLQSEHERRSDRVVTMAVVVVVAIDSGCDHGHDHGERSGSSGEEDYRLANVARQEEIS